MNQVSTKIPTAMTNTNNIVAGTNAKSQSFNEDLAYIPHGNNLGSSEELQLVQRKSCSRDRDKNISNAHRSSYPP